MCAALLFAGHETTVTRIDFGVVLLLDNPEQREALRLDPAKVDCAVEEILRVAVPSSSGGLVRDTHADVDGQHLTFGHGSRYCILASLARIELQEVFAARLGRFPPLRLAVPLDQPQLRTDRLTGGLAALPVTSTTE